MAVPGRQRISSDPDQVPEEAGSTPDTGRGRHRSTLSRVVLAVAFLGMAGSIVALMASYLTS